jgi:hypothetical protein
MRACEGEEPQNSKIAAKATHAARSVDTAALDDGIGVVAGGAVVRGLVGAAVVMRVVVGTGVIVVEAATVVVGLAVVVAAFVVVAGFAVVVVVAVVTGVVVVGVVGAAVVWAGAAVVVGAAVTVVVGARVVANVVGMTHAVPTRMYVPVQEVHAPLPPQAPQLTSVPTTQHFELRQLLLTQSAATLQVFPSFSLHTPPDTVYVLVVAHPVQSPAVSHALQSAPTVALQHFRAWQLFCAQSTFAAQVLPTFSLHMPDATS